MLGCTYLLLLVVFTSLQRKLLYYPSRHAQNEAVHAAQGVGLEPWRNVSGEIIGWQSAQPPREGAHRLLVLHGNAGSAIDRFNYVDGFAKLHSPAWDVRILEYPGYGARPGSPSRDSFAAAGREAIREWTGGSGPVFLLGESIGGGVACDLAADEPGTVGGLILITPFARLSDVAQMHFPWLPIQLILKDRWDNAAALKAYAGPVAVLLAGRDEVVGTAQGQSLFEAVKSPKRRWFFPNATHNDLEIYSVAWAREVSGFLLEAHPRN